MMKSKKILVALMVLSMIVSMTGCSYQPDYLNTEITEENRIDLINELNIELIEKDLIKGEIPQIEEVQSDTEEQVQFNYEMPDINNYEVDVKGNGEVDVEIFLPLENNGSSIRDLVKHVSENFNSSKLKNSKGKRMSVTIRCLDSSLAEDFIQYGSYMPHGYIASNELYGLLIQSKGIEVKEISSRLVGNTMGIAIEKEKYEVLTQKYGKVDVGTIVKANTEGNLSIGYTNPTNNPTGLNFVVSMLAYFDESNPSSFEATTDFSNFQNTVSSVSYSTEQMIKSVENGQINAFVIENQAYENDNSLESKFVFMPFGVRHDYPLYAMKDTTLEEQEVLKEFSKYFQNEKNQKYANNLNFNQNSKYSASFSTEKYPVGMITEILKFWKEGKNSGKQIVAIFVSDVSGSMSGKKIEALQSSLLNAMQYISEDAKVGLITYSDRVYYNLPIGEFTTEQQEYFVGAVNSLEANGGTATNNALLMAIKLLDEEEKKNSTEIKPIIILLSDGQSQNGYSLSSVKKLIEAFDYPIYTIGYGKDANVSELTKISEINTGTYIDSSTDDVGYKIKTLFDAEM